LNKLSIFIYFCLGSVNGSTEYMNLVQVRELESAQDWLQRVTLAKFKWTNGRFLKMLKNYKIKVVFKEHY
jgi:hypothetical protein